MNAKRTTTKQVLSAALGLLVLALGLVLMPLQAQAQDTTDKAMYRLYNSYTGEHLYTSSLTERDETIVAGWTYEGIGWYAPTTSNTPVYRLYNPYSGDHHYTLDKNEYDALGSIGWSQEGIGWYSDDNQTVPLYRQFNPYAQVGTHNYTTSMDEHTHLVSIGWTGEDIAWYGTAVGQTVESSQAIMGTTKTTAAQMARYFRKMKGNSAYPSIYASKGAATIEDFCQIVYEEATAEGVRAEVVFCQAMWETGWLQFGGDVNVAQCNFAGIGATGGGAKGQYFKDVREGIRAQVQHLKAYASTSALKNACVDPRFNLVKRGIAPTLPDLNGRWAVPGKNYGQDIYNLLVKLLES